MPAEGGSPNTGFIREVMCTLVPFCTWINMRAKYNVPYVLLGGAYSKPNAPKESVSRAMLPGGVYERSFSMVRSKWCL